MANKLTPEGYNAIRQALVGAAIALISYADSVEGDPKRAVEFTRVAGQLFGSCIGHTEVLEPIAEMLHVCGQRFRNFDGDAARDVRDMCELAEEAIKRYASIENPAATASP